MIISIFHYIFFRFSSKAKEGDLENIRLVMILKIVYFGSNCPILNNLKNMC